MHYIKVSQTFSMLLMIRLDIAVSKVGGLSS